MSTSNIPYGVKVAGT